MDTLTPSQRWYQKNRDSHNAKSMERYYANKEKIALQAKARYQRNRLTILAKGKVQRDALRAQVNVHKDVPCRDCGQRFPTVCMDFDHLGDKKDCVALMVVRCAPLKDILAEIAKCEVVCSNCHRIRTARRAGRMM